MLRKAKGFTLIELMIVVAIIGILAAIAIPNFVKFQCRSKQSEAKNNLKALYVAEESYRAENDEYASIDTIVGGANFDANSVTNPIGFVPKGEKLRYDYTATQNGDGFDADATANEVDANLATDSWTIDQTNNLQNAVNRCE